MPKRCFGSHFLSGDNWIDLRSGELHDAFKQVVRFFHKPLHGGIVSIQVAAAELIVFEVYVPSCLVLGGKIEVAPGLRLWVKEMEEGRSRVVETIWCVKCVVEFDPERWHSPIIALCSGDADR